MVVEEQTEQVWVLEVFIDAAPPFGDLSHRLAFNKDILDGEEHAEVEGAVHVVLVVGYDVVFLIEHLTYCVYSC